jgi:hypothetical protein
MEECLAGYIAVIRTISAAVDIPLPLSSGLSTVQLRHPISHQPCRKRSKEAPHFDQLASLERGKQWN